MEVDLCMWAKNGAEYLPKVLHRIDQVIPREHVHRRIFVDDNSTDFSTQIAGEYGWTVFPNEEGYVAGGCREALRHVDCDFFVGLEQDVLLSKDWWRQITPYMEDESVAVAQGVRIAADPVVRLLEAKEEGWSFDNNLHRAKVAKQIGFRNDEPFGADGFYRHDILQAGLKWIVDRSVISDHLRGGVRKYVRHEHIFNLQNRHPPKVTSVMRLALTSPLRGLELAVRENVPRIAFAYPYVRVAFLRDRLQRAAMR